MNLPENVLYGWIPLESLSNNDLWEKYYGKSEIIDKLFSFLTVLYQYGIQDIDIEHQGFIVNLQSDEPSMQHYAFG